MIRLEGISKYYYKNCEKIIALDNFSYEFDKGKFYAIMGHSGSGKSTLLSIIGLIDACDEGRYLMQDNDVSKMSDQETSMIRNEKIGFIFQEYYLNLYLKAYENVMLPMIINKKILKQNRKIKALELLKKFGLENRVNHYPKEMSGGEQQRVCLARSLANDPEIILADEPTGNLDEKNEELIFEKLKELSKTKCVIVISHSEKIKEYADVILNIQNGKLVK